MQTTYTAKVYGIAWAGYKASTEYTFYSHPTRAEILSRSGDFQDVSRIELTKRTVTVERCKAKAAA